MKWREAVVKVNHSPEVKMYGGWIHEEVATRSCFAGLERLIGKGKFLEAVEWLKNPDNNGFIPEEKLRSWLNSPANTMCRDSSYRRAALGEAGKSNVEQSLVGTAGWLGDGLLPSGEKRKSEAQSTWCQRSRNNRERAWGWYEKHGREQEE